ncbi:hypothetical protein MOQ_008866 [Trypanosoma cruzi marinkellei]|uniref:Uncharacterized protein n=1 Tax=Trypanosoma cruzi marinkellei TaxID=85056 RepID=K2LXL0_TRYCR|nr:hypothetical protein MOQ_008866 [Trypanosoma cruzi marinkellei]
MAAGEESMDFVFPEFVRASNDIAPPAPPQKSLWQLVMESGPNDVIPERVVPRRAAANYAGDYGSGMDAQYGMSEMDGDTAAAGVTGLNASRNHAAVGLTSRTSWTPAPYMIQHLMSSGFVSQFAMMHGVECSARLPPPPCLRLQDLQLPPLVLSRLRRQLFLPRDKKPLNSDVHQDTLRPKLRELQEIVFGTEAAPLSRAGTEGGGKEKEKKDVRQDVDGDEDDPREELGTMSALQQFAVTSMLLGHHTLSVGPRGTGKKTAGLLATGALTLARGIQKQEEEQDIDGERKNGPSNDGGAGDEAKVEMKHEPSDAYRMRPTAPRAMILVSSFHEVQRCNQWLQDVFTAGAFMPMTFRRGTAELTPLPVLYESSCDWGVKLPSETEARPPPSPPHPPIPPPVAVLPLPPSEEARHRQHFSHEGRREERSLHKRGRDHSRGRHHHHRHSHSPAARERAWSRRRRQRSSSRHHSRERRHRRGRSRDRHRDKKRRGSRCQHRHRSGDVSSSRSSRHDKKRSRHERSRSRHSHRHEDRHGEDWMQELSHRKSPVEEGNCVSLECAAVTEAPPPAAAHDTLMPTASCEQIPQFLQQHVPILIATHQSLVEALQMVRGQAEILPLECVRIACISDADRMAQPNSQMAVPTSWWISFSNAVDVECQYIVSASRMYDEVDGWLQETLLQDTPDVVNRYRQRDDTVWDGVQHIIEEVLVDEAEEYAAQHMFERVEAAKLRRLLRIVKQHFCSSHANSGGHSEVAGTHHLTHGSAASNPATPFTSSVGRMVVVVSSRKEQDSVFPQLLTGLRESDARVHCTCQLADFQRGEADVLVTYDWMLCVASDDGGVRNRPVDVVVNFGFPRALMAPGKEESLLECLVIRTRTLLHHTVSRDTMEEKGNGSFFLKVRTHPSWGRSPPCLHF